MILKNKKTVVTHNGGYHADDVFACATLALFYKGKIKIIRTRDEEKIKKADIVVDVGGEYDSEKMRFDHHQKEGAGFHDSKIPYASFGLVWKHFGPTLCDNNKAVWKKVDERLVQPIDGPDNGVSICEVKIDSISSYFFHDFLSSFLPTWQEKTTDKIILSKFKKMIKLAKEVILREIENAKAFCLAEQLINNIYEEAENKSILVIPDPIPRFITSRVLQKYTDVLFVVRPRTDKKHWSVESIKQGATFDSRKLLPEAWAGLRDKEIQKKTNIQDVVFCHRGRFLCVADTRESAIKLAKQAVES